MYKNSSLAKWWKLRNGLIECELCPQNCKLKEGEYGFCRVRKVVNNQLISLIYGKYSGICIDPIEKKPLYHFYPHSQVLSFGTKGCNLRCRFCQNFHLSSNCETKDMIAISAKEIIRRGKTSNCIGLAFTYNEPTISCESVIELAKKGQENGLKTILVTSGFISAKPRSELYKYIDAVNVDLKSFSDRFYQNICCGRLNPVLETLEYIKKETQTWLEITTLLIPGYNDSVKEIEKLSSWISQKLGSETPLHFTAFHPNYQMQNISPTPIDILLRSRDIAHSNGITHVYIGNIIDEKHNSTRCSNCRTKVITRRGYKILFQKILNGRCLYCDSQLAGRFF